MEGKMNMYYGASPSIFEKAKKLRNEMTEAEIKLWEFLSNNKVMGLRFKAQHPIYMFIVDFYCHSLRLVIEVDGSIHNLPEKTEYDENRTYELNRFNLKVIRFPNEQIINDFTNIKKEIINICNQRKAELQVL
jgi:very-short-patch-repair endonuclease